MNEMIERVARAIDEVLGADHESLSIEMGCGTIAKKLRSEAMVEAARAAIEAMREPTGEMVSAGIGRFMEIAATYVARERGGASASMNGALDYGKTGVYRAMIDAALTV